MSHQSQSPSDDDGVVWNEAPPDRSSRTDAAGESSDGRASRRSTADSHESARGDQCEECGGTVVVDHGHGDRACEDCGLVVETDRVDPGPEWRAFDGENRDANSRVGPPITNRQHDRGLSTTIDWRDRDAYGNSLDARQRAKMRRLRTWDERFRTRDSKERTLKLALGEIDRMACALDLPSVVRETASVTFRRALEEDLLPGRSVEGIATAAVYAAARQTEMPRSLDELAEVSRVDRQRLARAYRYVARELELGVEPARPTEYVRRFSSDLGLPNDVSARASELLENARSEGLHTGKSPTSMAAAAIYAGGLFFEQELTQDDVAAVTNVSDVTIRKRYRELLEADPDHPL